MMLHAIQRSPRSVITWVACVLIGVQAGVICAEEPATPPGPASPATKPVRTPTTRAAAKPVVPGGDEARPAQKFRLTRNGKLDPKSPLGLAVEEIRREYERGALRTESSYFRETPCNDLTTDNVFILLERNLGATPPVDAYIKWQLLSSLPRSLAAQYMPLVIAALNNAPVPIMTAGVITDDAQRQQVQREVARFNAAQAKTQMDKLDEERVRIHALNEPIIAYRTALCGLLDDSYDSIMAAFADAYHRGQAGADYTSAMDRAANLATAWLKTKPPLDMVRRLADAIAEVRGTKLNDVVAQFDWDENQRAFQLRCDSRTLDSGGRFRTLEMDLKQRLGMPQDGGQDNPGNVRRRGR